MAVEPVEILLQGVDNASGTIDKVNQKLVSSEEKYISKLKEQLIALRDGAEAAERFKLAEMGFSEETINAAVAIKQEIDAAKAMQAEADKLAKELEKAAKAQEDLNNTPSDAPKKEPIDWGAKAQSFADGFNQAEQSGKELFSYVLGISRLLANDFDHQAKSNRLMDEHLKQNEFLAQKRQEQFQTQIQIANLQTDSRAREELLREQLERVNAEYEQQAANVEELHNIQDENQGTWIRFAHDRFGLHQEEYAQANALVTEEEKRLEQLKQQKAELQDLVQGENEQFKLARERFELEQRRQQASQTAEQELNRIRDEIRELNDPGENERRRLEEMFGADGVTEAQRMELENLRATQAEAEERFRIEQEGRDEMRAAIEETRKAEADAYAELRKSIEDTQKAMEQQAEKDKGYLDNLRQRNILLKEGEQAAEEFRAAQAGVSQAAIDEGRKIAEENRKLEEQKKLEEEQKRKDEEQKRKLEKAAEKPEIAQSAAAAQLQATESRLLTGGSSNPAAEMVKKTDQLIALQRTVLGVALTAVTALTGIQANTAVEAETLGT